MFSKRLQVLLDERQYRRLEAYAKDHNLSVGAAVREALARALPAGSAERQAAADAIVAAPPMPVPSVVELRDELDELRARRA
jgi:hypothetical protein